MRDRRYTREKLSLYPLDKEKPEGKRKIFVVCLAGLIIGRISGQQIRSR